MIFFSSENIINKAFSMQCTRFMEGLLLKDFP